MFLVRVTLVSELYPEVRGSRSNLLPPFTTSCVNLQLGPLPPPALHRLQRSYGPVRHPQWPGLTLAGLQLGSTTHHRGLPVSRYSLYPHVLPSLSRRSVRLPSPLASPDMSAFPTIFAGVDLRITFCGTCSTFTARCGPRGRQATQRWPSTSKALTASLPPRPLRLLPAGEAVAGWVYLPLRKRTFSRRTKTARYVRGGGGWKRDDGSRTAGHRESCGLPTGA